MISSRTILPILCLVFVSQSWAAGTYDGKWVGTAPEAGDCGVLTVTLNVASNTVTGTVSGRHGSPAILPIEIGPDGVAQVQYAPFQARVRFAGEQFQGSFQTYCGLRNTIGKRVQ